MALYLFFETLVELHHLLIEFMRFLFHLFLRLFTHFLRCFLNDDQLFLVKIIQDLVLVSIVVFHLLIFEVHLDVVGSERRLLEIIVFVYDARTV
jgi:hypothetical protein